MGFLGGIIGGVGSIIGASKQAKAAERSAQAQLEAAKYAADMSLTGYNYLTQGAGAAPMQNIIDAGQQSLAGQGSALSQMGALLGVPPGVAPTPEAPQVAAGPGGAPTLPRPTGLPVAPPGGFADDSKPGGGSVSGGWRTPQWVEGRPALMQHHGTVNPAWLERTPPTVATPSTMATPPTGAAPPAAVPGASPPATPGVTTESANSAFDNYLNSTGYQFQLGQGQDAVGTSMAAKGMLNSGATLKGLTEFGQNLGSSYFNNYLGQLGNYAAAQGNRAGMGQNALHQIGSTGSTAGGGAANAIMAGAQGAGNARMAGANASAAGIAGAATNFGSALTNVLSPGGFGGFGGGINYFPPAPGGGGLY